MEQDVQTEDDQEAKVGNDEEKYNQSRLHDEKYKNESIHLHGEVHQLACFKAVASRPTKKHH